MKALFLDRDGVINIDYGYVYEIEKFKFSEGIFEFLKLFINKGYKLFIVTNQSGIARGLYTQKDFDKLMNYMQDVLKKENIKIEKIVHCPEHPDSNSKCRKPNTGMVDEILKEYPIDLKNSWMIGDKQSDIDLALNSGIEYTIAINSKKLNNSCYNFSSVKECYEFFKKNQNLIM